MSYPSDPHERMAAVRAAMSDRAVARAGERAAELGLALTDEQAAEAGRLLLKREQAQRASDARVRKAEKKTERDANFAVRLAREYAERYLDLWGSYMDGDVEAVKREFY